MRWYSEDRWFYYRRLTKKYVENTVYTVTKNEMKAMQFQKWDRVGRLTILWETESRKWYIYDKCKCDCWVIKFISRSHLRRWLTKSCWCLMKEKSKERLLTMNTKHWMYGTKIYSIFIHAKDRCNNKNNPWYKNYGWRWIRFMWDGFEDFYNDMWESYISHVAKYWKWDTTLDRIDVDWNYCKENCRWATIEEQNNNRRSNTRLVYMGKEYTSISKLASSFWIKKHIIYQRLKKWWDLKKSIETPVNERKFYN